MKKNVRFIFVDDIPSYSELEDNTVYVSTVHDVAQHKCLCGCGTLVVTPLSPVEWELRYNGKYSLYPSIGNWSLECKSHYFITNEEAKFARKYSDQEIHNAQLNDLYDLNEYKTLKKNKRCWWNRKRKL